MTRSTLQPRLHNPLASLLLLAWCLLSPDASAQSEPEQVEDPLFKMQKFDRELGLSADQLRRRSVATRVANFALNAVNFASIPVGMLPLPTISFAAEIAGTTTDNTLKFARPYLVAPPDVARSANTACYFQFDLPQTMTKYEDVLGLYRTLGGVRIRAPGNQTPVSFGVLGTPDVVHLNTDVRLSVHSPSAGIYRLAGVSFGTPGELPVFEIAPVAQTIDVPIGVHDIEWRAETLWYPLWDTAFPFAMTAVFMAMETKFLKHLDGLKARRADTAANLLDAHGNTKVLKKQLAQLDESIGVVTRMKGRLKKLEKYGLPPVDILGANKLADWFGFPVVTLFRSRYQRLIIYDETLPTITPVDPNPVFQASDPGGARTSRYLDELNASVEASDNCDGAVTLTNDAPTFLPIGDTIVTWTARDDGPVVPNTDHDGDGQPDNDAYNSTTYQQIVTVADTLPPILVPPPGLVFESDTAIDLNNEALGQPLVSDLGDLHPTVTNSTSSTDGIVTPDTRTIVTWSAADDGEPPNVATGDQLVTVKTPGTNSAPTVQNYTKDTLTSIEVDFVLEGFDPDELPVTETGELRRDPLEFRIEQRPEFGEFIAPLLPFFIDDFRTDKVGGLEAYFDAQNDDGATRAEYELALRDGQRSTWLDNEFCNQGQDVPIDFVLDPLYIHVRDNGEQFIFDHYYRCDPDVDTDIEIYQRISRWRADNAFLGHTVVSQGGDSINANVAALRIDADEYVNYVDPNTGSEAGQLSLQRCPVGMTDKTVTPPSCVGGFFGTINDGDMSDGADPTFAIADIERELVYASTRFSVDLFDFRLENPDNESGPRHARKLLGPLIDTGGAGFMGQNCTQAANGSFDNPMEIDSVGNLYVVDNNCDRIHKFTPSYFDDNGDLVRGDYVGWMGRCTTSTNLACDDENQRSKGFSCTDTTCSVGDGVESGDKIGQFLNPSYIAVDPNDIIYVADYGNQRIQRFDTDGTFAGQAASTGNGINADTDGGFVLGNMGPPKHVSVNSQKFYVVDQSENFVHVFDASPFKNVTSDSATVTYVSKFNFHSAADSFSYSVNDGLVDSNIGVATVNVARNYRQPEAEAQEVEVLEDRSVVILLKGTDPDGVFERDFNGLDTLTFEIVQYPQSGTLVHGGDAGDTLIDAGMDVWTYTPDTDFFGQDTFSFSVSDAFTNETVDGATVIPQPYGPTEPEEVPISVIAVNDIPTVEIEPPGIAGTGFPFQLSGTARDDFGSAFEATVYWGDGTIDRNGEAVFDDNGTPNDSSDDTATMTGVVFSAESMEAAGETPMHVIHTYSSTGSKQVQMCMRDAGLLESCSSVTIEVEDRVAIGARMTLSDSEIVDGLLFDATVEINNGVPMAPVVGMAAANVQLVFEIPPQTVVASATTASGACVIGAGLVECSLGTLANGAEAIVDMVMRGTGVLVYDAEVNFEALITTDSPAIGDEVLAYNSIQVLAANLDRDDDGLPNIFEAAYGVENPDDDDDGDGLTNAQELEAETSPIDSDSDGDGISDGAEINLYGSNPNASDSDGDGISDGDEVAIHGTNPANEDSDGDGLPDNWEVDNGYDPLVDDSSGDPDGDGLSDRDEYANQSDHLNPDTDGDTVSDGDEVHLYDGDPASADTDNDGLDDGDELIAGTRLDKADTDDDGLFDGFEVNVTKTSPLLRDTDRDGLRDGFENLAGRNALFPDYLIAAGGLTSCAITDDGVECWGRDDFNQATPPALNDPLEVTVGYVHACALDVAADGSRSVICWGDDTQSQSSPPPLNDPQQVAAGGYHTCALDRAPGGEVGVVCWGRDVEGQVSEAPAALESPLRLVASISGNSSCVLDDTAAGLALICWGQNDNADGNIPTLQSNVPGALALGSEHGCVMDGDQRICWGLDDDGQAPTVPVTSSTVELSLGGFHSCALTTEFADEYQAECWGLDANGQASVPGTLVNPLRLASGSHHSCAFDEGSLKCWGVENSFDLGQAPASLPLSIDPDGDTIITAVELAQGTDPLDPDTDRDQVDDATEATLGTDPTNADTDGDGLRDGEEIATYFTNPLLADSDGDGMPDDWEIDNELDPLVDDADLDADSDGLVNLREFANDTDPHRSDTDDDGITDAAELQVIGVLNTGQLLGTSISEAVALGDLDADGDLDAVVANRDSAAIIWLNDGFGGFSQSETGTLNELGSLDVAIGDIDQDGDPDIVLAHPDYDVSNTVWLNSGDDGSQDMFANSGLDLGPGTSDAVALFEEAGLVGLYVGNWGTDSAFTFLLPDLQPHYVGDSDTTNTEDIAVGDLDGDSRIDVFVVNRDQPNQVIRGVDILPYKDYVDTGQQLGNEFSTAVALGDLDGDGDLDAFEVVFGAGDRIWLNAGGLVFEDSGQRVGNDGGNDVVLTDLDADADLDAIVANTGNNRIWLNQGGTMIDSGVVIGGGTTFGLAAGDLDGDGLTDFFLANDGANEVWLGRRLDPANADTDGDNAYDGWEIDNGLDPLDDSDGDGDPDGDGLSNRDEFDAGTDPNVADTDGDGMPDGWEVQNSLDPTVDDAMLDRDRDGLPNLDEYQAGGSAEEDDVPPELVIPPAVIEDSTGPFTDVAIGSATAVDARDGPVTPTVDNPGPYPPGDNPATWSAKDFSGNEATQVQSVGVIPQVSLGVDRTVVEGDTIVLDLMLNGAAVDYPVQVNYTVEGTATNPDDHDAAAGSVMIGAGTTGGIPVSIVRDLVFEPAETFTVTIADIVNAIPGPQTTQTITIAENNRAPVATIVMRQQGHIVTTAVRGNGPVTVTAIVADPNNSDTHGFDWRNSDSGAFDPADALDAEYAIDPVSLNAGFYRISVDVTDSGVPALTNTADAMLRILDVPPALLAGVDSDGDGIDDATEGYGDADNDRVPDYLDATANDNVLPYGDDTYVVETQPGLTLRLGEYAFQNGAVAGIPESAIAEDVDNGYPNKVADFEILGVEPGGTALVVIPLERPIPAGSSYRKYINNNWQDFVVDDDNEIWTARGSRGACPSPGDTSYDSGTSPGDGCVQLRLEDGGPNDADGTVNGSIRDPGGLAVPVAVSVTPLAMADRNAGVGEAGVVVATLQLETESGDAELDAITLQASGSGDDAKQIRAVTVYVDSNNNRRVDNNEPAIGSGTYDANDGTVVLRMSPSYVIPLGTTTLLVTYDF